MREFLSDGSGPAFGQQLDQQKVVEKQDAERKNQIVQESVVGGQDDADLESGGHTETHYAKAPREKKHPHQHQLHEERNGGRGSMEPMRKLLCIPADPRGQRTVLIIIVHRGEMAP